MQQRYPAYLRSRSLFAGASAGAYTLPADLLAAHTTAIKIDRRIREQRDSRAVDDARGQFRNDLLDAIDQDRDLPDPIVIRQAAEQDRAWSEQSRILADIAEHAQIKVVATMHRLAEEIIVDHLRPALDKTITAASKAAPHLGRTFPDAEEALTSSAAMRKAYLELDKLAGRYGALRAAQTLLNDMSLPDPRFDYRNRFRELRNAPDLISTYVIGRATAPKTPWPDSPRGRLFWLVTSGAEPWMPTPDDQDQVFAEWYPKADCVRGVPTRV